MSEIDALIDQLAGDPENVSVLVVLGDLLQREADPRGELIAMQLGGVEGAVAIARRRAALLEQLTPVVPDVVSAWSRDRFRWGTGYVRAIDLGMYHDTSRPHELLTTPEGRAQIAAALGELWAHPSLRILSEVSATHSHNVSVLAVHPPPTVRALTIGRGVAEDLDAIPTLLAGLPRLERVRLVNDIELHRFAHANVSEIIHEAFSGSYPLRDLAPSLRRLSIKGTGDLTQVCFDLAYAGWLAQLTHLALPGFAPTERCAIALADGLAGRKLERLDVGPTPGPILDLLSPLADEVAATP